MSKDWKTYDVQVEGKLNRAREIKSVIWCVLISVTLLAIFHTLWIYDIISLAAKSDFFTAILIAAEILEAFTLLFIAEGGNRRKLRVSINFAFYYMIAAITAFVFLYFASVTVFTDIFTAIVATSFGFFITFYIVSFAY